MNIEIRTDKNIAGSERLIDYIRSELKTEFQRFSEKITHFEVHLRDENDDKDSKNCMIEARPAGLKPVVIRHKANNIDAAIHGAIDKLKRAIEQTFDKQEPVRGSKPDWSTTE